MSRSPFCVSRRPLPRLLLRSAAVLLAASALRLPAQQLAAAADLPDAPGSSSPDALPAASPVTGTVRDSTGAIVPGAHIVLRTATSADPHETDTDGEGNFTMPGAPDGPYQLTVSLGGFRTWTTAGTAAAGQPLAFPEVALALDSAVTEIAVSASRQEIAAAQVELEEKQRILGVFPNFYASYVWNAEPLSVRQKFSLAWRFSVDPVAFAMAGVVAGSEQAQNAFSGYGQGTLGYARRYGASYADGVASTILGQAVFPALFHQDPRFFVKETGTVTQRTLYALATTVMCRGDNGRWQPNYSNMLGNLASASLSNVYYPASDRHGLTLTLQNSLVTTAAGAFGGLMQEFVLRHMTPNVPDYDRR